MDTVLSAVDIRTDSGRKEEAEELLPSLTERRRWPGSPRSNASESIQTGIAEDPKPFDSPRHLGVVGQPVEESPADSLTLTMSSLQSDTVGNQMARSNSNSAEMSFSSFGSRLSTETLGKRGVYERLSNESDSGGNRQTPSLLHSNASLREGEDDSGSGFPSRLETGASSKTCRVEIAADETDKRDDCAVTKDSGKSTTSSQTPSQQLDDSPPRPSALPKDLKEITMLAMAGSPRQLNKRQNHSRSASEQLGSEGMARLGMTDYLAKTVRPERLVRGESDDRFQKRCSSMGSKVQLLTSDKEPLPACGVRGRIGQWREKRRSRRYKVEPDCDLCRKVKGSTLKETTVYCKPCDVELCNKHIERHLLLPVPHSIELLANISQSSLNIPTLASSRNQSNKKARSGTRPKTFFGRMRPWSLRLNSTLSLTRHSASCESAQDLNEAREALDKIGKSQEEMYAVPFDTVMQSTAPPAFNRELISQHTGSVEQCGSWSAWSDTHEEYAEPVDVRKTGFSSPRVSDVRRSRHTSQSIEETLSLAQQQQPGYLSTSQSKQYTDLYVDPVNTAPSVSPLGSRLQRTPRPSDVYVEPLDGILMQPSVASSLASSSGACNVYLEASEMPKRVCIVRAPVRKFQAEVCDVDIYADPVDSLAGTPSSDIMLRDARSGETQSDGCQKSSHSTPKTSAGRKVSASTDIYVDPIDNLTPSSSLKKFSFDSMECTASPTTAKLSGSSIPSATTKDDIYAEPVDKFVPTARTVNSAPSSPKQTTRLRTLSMDGILSGPPLARSVPLSAAEAMDPDNIYAEPLDDYAAAGNSKAQKTSDQEKTTRRGQLGRDMLRGLHEEVYLEPVDCQRRSKIFRSSSEISITSERRLACKASSLTKASSVYDQPDEGSKSWDGGKHPLSADGQNELSGRIRSYSDLSPWNRTAQSVDDSCYLEPSDHAQFPKLPVPCDAYSEPVDALRPVDNYDNPIQPLAFAMSRPTDSYAYAVPCDALSQSGPDGRRRCLNPGLPPAPPVPPTDGQYSNPSSPFMFRRILNLPVRRDRETDGTYYRRSRQFLRVELSRMEEEKKKSLFNPALKYWMELIIEASEGKTRNLMTVRQDLDVGDKACLDTMLDYLTSEFQKNAQNEKLSNMPGQAGPKSGLKLGKIAGLFKPKIQHSQSFKEKTKLKGSIKRSRP